MKHIELLSIIQDRLKLDKIDEKILKDIIAGLADKDDSIFEFYTKLTTAAEYITLPLVKKLAEDYSVPKMYEDHIEKRFEEFKANLKTVYTLNCKSKEEGRSPGYIPSKWLKSKAPMFGSTELMTIDKVGGLESIGEGMFTVGYFDYLKKIFKESATDISKLKYSNLIKASDKMIESKK